jgi:lysine 2,3-aminomutase
VNDDPEIMRIHVQKLLMCRVRPYYLYQCDLIAGSAHLRTSVRRGLEILRQLRGYTTGYAVPTYVIDAPGGGGKVPLTPEYVVRHTAERLLLRNYKGELYEYPEAPDEPLPSAPARPRCEPECV